MPSSENRSVRSDTHDPANWQQGEDRAVLETGHLLDVVGA